MRRTEDEIVAYRCTKPRACGGFTADDGDLFRAEGRVVRAAPILRLRPGMPVTQALDWLLYEGWCIEAIPTRDVDVHAR